MAAQGVITEFLASVGFKADEKSLKSALVKVAGFGVAVKMAAVGIYAGLQRVATAEADIARQARQLGTSTEKLRELGYMAEQSESNLDAVTRSMENLVSKNPRIKDAAKALETVGNRMQRMNEQARKAYAARMGIDPSLIPMLTRDVTGLKEEFRQMYAVAGTDAKEAAMASKGFLAELAKLSTIAGLLGRAVAISFIGRVRHDIEHLRRVIMDNFNRIRRVLEVVIAVILRLSAVISAAVYRVISFVSSIVAWFDTLEEGQQRALMAIGALILAWKVLNAGFLATPIGWIIGGLMALVALVDDYLTFMEGGESYFDWSPWAASIEEVLAALKPVLGVVIGIGQGIIASVAPAMQAIRANLDRLIQHFKLMGQFFRQLWAGDFAEALETGMAMISNLQDMVLAVFSGMANIIKAFFAAMWPSVEANFPDFAAWANRMKEPFSKAIDWIKEKFSALTDILPDFVKDKMGINIAATQAAQATSGPALIPSPAQASNMGNTQNKHVELTAKTEIHMHTADPVTAGNQVAAKQDQVNAETVRNMKGAVK